jgi:hypothetical protein
VDETARRIHLDELSDHDLARKHLDAIPTAGTRIKPCVETHPTDGLLGIDEERPDRLR